MEKGRTEAGPDRGWSWVIVCAAFFVSLVLAGIFRTGGVLFVAFIDAFGVTREEASWPMVICITVLNLTGPFSGILGQRFGARPIVMIGALVAAIGVSSCFFLTSLEAVTILFGGVFGIGYGLINTLIPVILNAYFLNLRGLANGIANSGSCFGSMILPIFFEFLIEHYGLAACFLLTGGVVLNLAVAGALLRPPLWLKKKRENIAKYSPVKIVTESVDSYQTSNNSEMSLCKRKTSNNPTNNCFDSTKLQIPENSNSQDSSFDLNIEAHNDLHAELSEALKTRAKVQNDCISNAFAPYKDPSSDSLFTPSSPSHDSNSNKPNNELFRAQQEFQESLNDFQSTVISITSQSEEVLNKIDEETDNTKASELTNYCPARHSFSISSRKPKNKQNKSLFLPNKPLKKSNLKFENSSGELFSALKSHHKPSQQSSANSSEYKKVSVTVMDDIEEEEKQDEPDDNNLPCEESTLNILRSFQSVLSSPMFYVTTFTNVSFYFLFHMYVVIIVDFSLDRGVPDTDTKYIIFAFSGADLFGRLCFGWITDRQFVTRSRFTMICMAAIGIVFFTFPFATDYWTLILASCGYGVLLGCTMVIFPILLVDYLGTELHAISFGCLCFANGFASLVRPLIIGYFRDNLGSYSNMFYILGIISLVASSSWILEKFFVHKKVEESNLEVDASECLKQNGNEENEN